MENNTAGQPDGEKKARTSEELGEDYYLDSDFDDTDLPEIGWEEDILYDPPSSKTIEKSEEKNRRKSVIEEETEKIQGEKKENQKVRKEEVARQTISRETKQEILSGSSLQRQPEKKKGNGGKIAGGIFAAGLLAGIAVYGVKAQSYKQKFFPNTWINGINVENMTVEEVKEKLSVFMEDYQIVLTDREFETERITKDDIGLYPVFDGTLEQMMQDQNPYVWGIHKFKDEDFQINTMADYDKEKFSKTVDRLKFFDPGYVRQEREAYLSEYQPEKGYEIIPKDPGNEVDKNIFTKALSQAVLTMKPDFSLEEAGCYIYPLSSTPDPILVEQRDRLNRYATMSITYTFGNRQEVLSGEQIHQWVSFDENNQPVVDEAKVKEFVERLAKTYNTAYTKRKFKTSYGSEVEVSGFYGWKINQKAEAAALAQLIAEGESVIKEPEYSQEGASHEGNDYGNTYVEVNLTAQHLFLYKEGKVVLESDFVSGNVARGFTTPPGIFSINYKQRDAVLKGQGYASPVKFWMPFNGGIGFHDASWRNSFGGSIYRTNGSHGCINMPYSTAKSLFELIDKGMPVICYNLSGTGSGKSTYASGSGGSPTPATSAAQPASVPETTPDPALLPSDPSLIAGSESAVLESGADIIPSYPEESSIAETLPAEIPSSSEVPPESSSEVYIASEQEETTTQPTGPGYVQTEPSSQPQEQTLSPSPEQTAPSLQEQPAPSPEQTAPSSQEQPALPSPEQSVPVVPALPEHAGEPNPGENLPSPGM